jgi:hypothetical protein
MPDYRNHHYPKAFICILQIEVGWSSHWRFNMACIASRVGLLLLVALAAGCATMRTGSGSAVSGANPVQFGWTSRGNDSGSMTATFANGRTFTGQFSQITSDLTHELGPQGPIWHQEGLYDVGPSLQSVPHYTGRVVANLSGSNGAQMRCHFELMRPVDGMSGGAHGECQLPDGLSVDAQFPAD